MRGILKRILFPDRQQDVMQQPLTAADVNAWLRGMALLVLIFLLLGWVLR